MVATQVAASTASALAPQPMDAKMVNTLVRQTTGTAPTTGTENLNATDEAHKVSNTESSTAEEVAKEPLTAALSKYENVEQSNQDLQDDETSMEQSQATTARSFPSAVFDVKCHHSSIDVCNPNLPCFVQAVESAASSEVTASNDDDELQNGDDDNRTTQDDMQPQCFNSRKRPCTPEPGNDNRDPKLPNLATA